MTDKSVRTKVPSRFSKSAPFVSHLPLHLPRISEQCEFSLVSCTQKPIKNQSPQKPKIDYRD